MKSLKNNKSPNPNNRIGNSYWLDLYKKIILTCLLSFFVFGAVFSQSSKTFSTGSYIIDMGVMPQTVNNGLKPYGLVYSLLEAGVPVCWSINPNKVKDGVDFAIGSTIYKGGPFIIAAEYSSLAAPIINTWKTNYPGLKVDTSPTSFTAPIHIQLSTKPRWVLDAQNGGIAQGFLQAASIPAGSVSQPNYYFKSPQLLNGCDDIYVMPHADPAWSTHNNLLSWNLTYKGAIWAACHAVSALENTFNTANPSEQLNFLSEKTGIATGGGPYASNNSSLGNSLILWGKHSGGSPPYTYQLSQDPVMQFMGIADAAMQNGSEQIYIPITGWRASTKLGTIDPTQANVPAIGAGPAAAIAYGQGFGDPARGKVMYEAAHNIGGTGSDNIAAQRAFFNFSIWAAQDKAMKVTSSNIPSTINGGTTSNLFNIILNAPSPSGPYTFEWISSCGGIFSNKSGSFNTPAEAIAATSTNFTAPPAPTVSFNCPLICKIKDACGRETIFSSVPRILSLPVAPVANLDVKGTLPETQVTVYPLNNDTDSNLDQLTVKGLGLNGSSTIITTANGKFAIGPNNTIIYLPNPGFTGTDSVIYMACDPGPLCDTAFVKIIVTENLGPCGIGFKQIKVGTGNAISYVTTTVTSVVNPSRALGVFDGSNYAELDKTGSAAFTLDLGNSFNIGDTIKIRFASRTSGNQVTLKAEGAAATPVSFSGAAVNFNSSSATMADYIYVVTAANTRYLKLQNNSTLEKLRVDGVVFDIKACVVSCAVSEKTIKKTKYGSAVFSQTGVSGNTNILGAPDASGAQFGSGDIMILDLGEQVSQNNVVILNLLLAASSSSTSSINVASSPSSGGPFTGSKTFTTLTANAYATAIYTLPTGGGRYLQITGWSGDKEIRIDAATFVSTTCIDITPKALNDTINICEDNVRIINTLNNDLDPQGLALSTTITTNPLHGIAVVNSDQTITYTPIIDYFGTDEITYKACNSLGFCSTAKIKINITDDLCPTANQYKPAQFTSTSVTLSGTTNTDDNWLDAGTQTDNNGTNTVLSVDRESDKPNRTLIKFNLSSIPTDAIITSASLQLYKINNKVETIDVYRITNSWNEGIKNGATPTAPNAGSTWLHRTYDNQFWTKPGGDYDSTKTIATQTTTSSTNLYVNWDVTKLVQAWNDGILNKGFLLKARDEKSLNTDNAVTFNSSEQTTNQPQLVINYKLPNCTVALCEVIPNRPPLAKNDDTCAVYNTTISYNVANNDKDPENNLNLSSVQKLSINGYPKYGIASASGSNIIYTPNSNNTKTDTIYYRIFDTGSPALSDTAFLVVCVDNVPITAVDDISSTPSGTTVSIDVKLNDINPLGGNSTLSKQDAYPPSNGIIEIVDGKIEYTPNPGFTGVDKFEYIICNNNFPPSCDTALVTVTVNNQAPLPEDDNVLTISCVPITINVLDNDSDPEGNSLLTVSIGTPSPTGKGTFTLNNAGTAVIFSPNSTFVSGNVVTIPYTITDDGTPKKTATANITVTFGTPPVNNPPVAGNDNFTSNTNEKLYADVLSNDYDPDGDLLQTRPSLLTGADAPQHGTATVLSNGLIEYTPTLNYVGPDAFKYRICDSINVATGCVRTPNCSVATVNINLTCPSVVSTPSVTTPVIYCKNASASALTATGSSGTSLVWYTTYNGVGSTTAPIPNTTAVGSTSYWVSSKITGTSCESEKIEVIVVINDLPVTPTASVTTQPTCLVKTGTITITNPSPAANLTFKVTGINPIVAGVTQTTAIFSGLAPGIYSVTTQNTLTGCNSTGTSLTVTNFNCLEAEPDMAAATAGITTNIPVLDNDTNADDTPVTDLTKSSKPVITSMPAKGSATVLADGSIEYTPFAGTEGADTLIYQICDLAYPAVCDTAMVIIDIKIPDYDVALISLTNSDCQVAVGDTVTFTIKVFRQDKSIGNVNLSVIDSLASNLRLVSFSATVGIFEQLTGKWTDIYLNSTDTATLTLKARVMTSIGGLSSNVAWVNQMDQLDIDSNPGNKDLSEDDMGKTSISIPLQICSERSEYLVITAPSGYNSYQWLKNGLLIDGENSANMTAKSAGLYQVILDNVGCTGNDCCPIIIEDTCNCIEFCLPISIKKSK